MPYLLLGMLMLVGLGNCAGLTLVDRPVVAQAHMAAGAE